MFSPPITFRTARISALIRHGVRLLQQLIGMAVFSLLVAATLIVSYFVVRYIVWPGYVDPQSRMYTSRLGYAAMLRQQGRPFPVKTAAPAHRVMTQRYTGEGFVRAQPVIIPIVPMARIVRVHVAVGDEVQKGDLLIELDKTQARLRLDATKVAFEVAKAELARTRIGTVYVMDNERPDQDAIEAISARKQAEIKKELDQRAEGLYQRRLISKELMLERKLDNVKTSAEVEKADIALKKSRLGHKESIRIAEAELRSAFLAYQQREAELADFDVYSPANGIIERRLVNDGEYNQDPGRPAFLLAVGKWFEAHFDQTTIGKIEQGDAAMVQLEAFAGNELEAQVTVVQPFVSFNSSGPEINRPIRPSGTGAPEWPSSFPVRLQIAPTTLPVTIGLSGFARVYKKRTALCVPTTAVLSRSCGCGVVCAMDGDNQFERRKVALGDSTDGWTEIRSGLTVNDEVIIDGHYVLIDGDSIIVDRDGEDADHHIAVERGVQ